MNEEMNRRMLINFANTIAIKMKAVELTIVSIDQKNASHTQQSSLNESFNE